jgi:hypothetical protein
MLFALVLVFLAPLAPAALAPGPHELDAAVAGMDARVARMEAIETALGRVQGAWAEKLAAGEKPDPCSDPAAASLVARSRALGRAYRDAVQSSRAQLTRLEYLWSAPTVSPLLDDDDLSRGEDLRRIVTEHTLVWLEAAAWQERFVDPTARRCDPDLAVAAGIAYAGAPAITQGPVPVAILALGGATVCPGAEPADGRVVVVPSGKACLGSSDCTCEPVDVLPAEVLGP